MSDFSGLAIVWLDGSWVYIYFGLDVSLRRQLIELTIYSLGFWIDVFLVLKCHLGQTSSISFLHLVSFLDKSLLKLCWLWIESVVVLPFLLEETFFIENTSEGAHKRENFHVSKEFVLGEMSSLVDLTDLHTLESSWNKEEQ